MWKSFNQPLDSSPKDGEKMRYFIYYPPKKTIRLIDASRNVLVDDILDLVKKEFSLNVEDSRPAETVLVLNYNGAELKGKWSLLDLGIPSGSIIRCIHREILEAQIHVHCDFNKQILKLFDHSITAQTTIGVIRQKISDKIGLPLSTFCLQRFDDQKRLFDSDTLEDRQIKVHGHVLLKVWSGYEKLISSCVKGFSETYSSDDLTRYYQIQIALYISAFYGHMELATNVMQLGARTDRPVGEHPSRQWSSEYTEATPLEHFRSPIHIAVEKGNEKMVDLFVRQSIHCTQIRDPKTGHLPYLLALSCSLKAKSKEEKQRFREIYFALQNKQFNMRIPLNATGEVVHEILTSTVSAKLMNRSLSNKITVSLPIYCRIISWYERAREKAWKKYGGRFYNPGQSKRVFPKTGLLGYKVLIDGCNHNFEVPTEQSRNAKKTSEQDDFRYSLYTSEERMRIHQVRNAIKESSIDDRTRAKQVALLNLKKSRRPPNFFSRRTSESDKSRTQSVSENNEQTTTNSNETSSRKAASIDEKFSFQLVRAQTNIVLPTKPNRTEHLPTLSNARSANPLGKMSSADAFSLSASRRNEQNREEKQEKHRQTLNQIENSLQQPVKISQTEKKSQIPKPPPMLDLDSYIPLPERSSTQRSSLFQNRADVQVFQSTVKPYERYASASARRTAVTCLQEATFLKGKTWLQKVEISKEMMKSRVKHRIQRAAPQLTSPNEISKSKTLPVT